MSLFLSCHIPLWRVLHISNEPFSLPGTNHLLSQKSIFQCCFCILCVWMVRHAEGSTWKCVNWSGQNKGKKLKLFKIVQHHKQLLAAWPASPSNRAGWFISEDCVAKAHKAGPDLMSANTSGPPNSHVWKKKIYVWGQMPGIGPIFLIGCPRMTVVLYWTDMSKGWAVE